MADTIPDTHVNSTESYADALKKDADIENPTESVQDGIASKEEISANASEKSKDDITKDVQDSNNTEPSFAEVVKQTPDRVKASTESAKKPLTNGVNHYVGSPKTPNDVLPNGVVQNIEKVDEKGGELVTGKSKEHKKIRWAPLKVPIQRRLETLVVVLFGLAGLISLGLFWFMAAVPLTWPFLIPYLIYISLANPPQDTPPRNIFTPIFRSQKVWSYFTNYFPMKLHRSVELSPNENYIFGYHPHGIISHGAWGNFVTKTTGWNELFPGISNTVLTLETNFRLPLYREYLIAMGLGSVSRKSCEGLLGGVTGEVSEGEVNKTLWDRAPKLFARPQARKPESEIRRIASGFPDDKRKNKPANKKGRGITIVIGGAQESLFAKPGTLTLKMRKGFLRVACRTGAHVVPVLSFGENDLFDQHIPERSSPIYKFQIMVKRVFGFTIPLFHARGIFNYDVGLVPYRTPVNTVVGRPITTVQSPTPRDDYIDELQEKYCAELQRLWDEHKDKFAKHRKSEMQIIR